MRRRRGSGEEVNPTRWRYGTAVVTQIIGIDALQSMTSPLPIVAVVDVMRAFTTAAVVLAHGADAVVLAASRAEALELRQRHAGAIAVKDGAPDPDFDGVNSPVLIGQSDVAGRAVVLCTTNGTVGAAAARSAPGLVLASFVVAGATARYLRRIGGSATFVATGDQGRAHEDVSCAEFIGELLHDRDVDPAPYLQRAATSAAATDLAQAARRGYPGVHPGDVALCLDLDRFSFAMVATVINQDLVVRAVR